MILALKEDIGSGDITSRAIISAGIEASGRIVAKGRGAIAGLEVAEFEGRKLSFVEKREKNL